MSTEFKLIRAKFAGKCACCGRRVYRGESVVWNMVARAVSHVACHGAKFGNVSATVAGVDHGANDYAGDGLDSRYEDDCARACGLL